MPTPLPPSVPPVPPVPARLQTYRHHAMATWFELRIATDDAHYAAQAAQEIWPRIDQLESLLSRYREDSEVRQLGRLAPGETLRLQAATADCLRLALQLAEATGGAFDPALGHLKPVPTHATATATHSPRGRLLLDPELPLARCEDGPVHLDLGALGKGYALDVAASVLLEWELPHALLIAGGSSLRALAAPPGQAGWRIGLTAQQDVWLVEGSLGASGAAHQGVHIYDPRTGQPTHRYARTWASAPSAAAADALSTAAMLSTPEELHQHCARWPQSGLAVLENTDLAENVRGYGVFPVLVRAAAPALATATTPPATLPRST